MKEISYKHLKSCICRWTEPTRTLWRLQRSNLPKLIASERERLSDPEWAGLQPAATKHHGSAGAGGGRRSPSNSQWWHAHSAIDLAFIHSPCAVVSSPTAISLLSAHLCRALSSLSFLHVWVIIATTISSPSKEVSISFYWGCQRMK